MTEEETKGEDPVTEEEAEGEKSVAEEEAEDEDHVDKENDNQEKTLTSPEEEEERRRQLESASGATTKEEGATDNDANDKQTSDENQDNTATKTVNDESQDSQDVKNEKADQTTNDERTQTVSETAQSAQVETSNQSNDASSLIDETNRDNETSGHPIVQPESETSEPILKGDIAPENEHTDQNIPETDKTNTTSEDAMAVNSMTTTQEPHKDTEEQAIKSALDECINHGGPVQECLDTIADNSENVDFTEAKGILVEAINNSFDTDSQSSDTYRDTMQLAADLVYGMADMFSDSIKQTYENITEMGDALVEQGMNEATASGITETASNALLDSIDTKEITSQFGDYTITYNPDFADDSGAGMTLNESPSYVTDVDGFMLDVPDSNDAIIKESGITADSMANAFETGMEAAKIIVDTIEATGTTLSDSQINDIEKICAASAFNMQQGQQDVTPIDVANALGLDTLTQNATDDTLKSAIETRDALQNGENIITQPEITANAVDTSNLSMEALQQEADRQAATANTEIQKSDEPPMTTEQNPEVDQINSELGEALRDITNIHQETPAAELSNATTKDENPDDIITEKEVPQPIDTSGTDGLASVMTGGDMDSHGGGSGSGDDGGNIASILIGKGF